MGEARRRKGEIEAVKMKALVWLDSLTPEDRLVADAAQRAYDNIVVGLGMTEACYHLAFFLREYVRRHHDLDVSVAVGWVNDGRWQGAASHAWLEWGGRRIDIALHRTSHPDVQPSGDLVILDYVVKRGEVTYTYSRDIPEQARQTLEAMAKDDVDVARIIRHKQVEHERMEGFAKSSDGAERYLKEAPADSSYASLERRMKR